MARFSAFSLASVFSVFAGTSAATDLTTVYKDAVLNDPQIRQAEATRRASREVMPQAIAALLPQISGTASVERDSNSSLYPEPATTPDGKLIAVSAPIALGTTTKQWALNLKQNVFSWSNWMTLKEANAQVAQAEATYAAAEQSLIQRVSQAYFTVLSAIDNLDAQQASLLAFSQQLDQANKRYEVGLIPITDVEDARAARDSAAAAVIAAKRTLATNGNQLAEITGKQYDSLSKPGAELPLSMPDPASEDRWVDISMEQNATLLAARLAADVARDNVKVQFGGHLPSLDIVAGKTYSDATASGNYFGFPASNFITENNDKNISLQITVPIFSGGMVSSKTRQAQFQWIAAKEAMVQSSRATERAARDAYLGVIAGIARVKALRQAMESNETAVKATEAGYEVGTRTAVDLVNARQKLVQAQTEYYGSRYDYINAVINLRLAAGNLDKAQVELMNGALTLDVQTAPSASPTPESMTPPPAPPTPNVPITPETVRPPAGTQQPAGREPRPR